MSNMSLLFCIGLMLSLYISNVIFNQIDPVDGHARDEVRGENGEIKVTDSTFTQRNSYVGLKGSFGTLKLGKHDKVG